MYHGEVNVYQEDLQDFLTVAEELKLRGLRQEVEDVKDHGANGGRSFEGNDDDVDEVILRPEQNMTGDTDDIADTEEMIDAMMERGADGDWRCVSCGKTAGKYKNNL